MTTLAAEEDKKTRIIMQHPSHLKNNPDPEPFCMGGIYSCPCCSYSSDVQFNFKNHMNNHLKQAVKHKGYFICKCNRQCRTAAHFHCLYCSQTIIRKNQCKLHLSQCIPTTRALPSPSASPFPSVSGSDASGTQQHISAVSPTPSPAPAPTSPLSLPPKCPVQPPPQSKRATVTCRHCGLTLKKRNLRIHLKRKHKLFITTMPTSPDHQTHLVLENYIGGKFVACRDLIDSYNPSTGQVYCSVPDSGQDEVNAAVAAAKEAFPDWSSRSPEQRAQVLNKLADLIEANLDEFAQAESIDQGKTLAFARTVDIPRSVHNFRFFASSVLHHTNDSTQMDHMGCLNYTVRSPVGVAGLISPWNLPLYLLTWKIAPAVAAGNTVVAKPSEMTSVTAWMMCKLMQEAGVPPGVINIVFGTGPKAGDTLVGHPDVPLVSFTGSTATAQRITERSAPYCKKLSLELGGKNPALIFADADLDQCVATTVRSSFSNQGEICLCTSRIYVERSIYPEFLEKFVAAARKWKTGAPSDPGSHNGALISKEHLEKVRSFVALARSEGATVHCGEGVDQMELPARHAGGYFLPATVITGVADTSRVMQEEIFGPVTCVSPFDTEEEAVARGNGVRFGLGAVVWSRDVGRVHRVAGRIQAGLVWTNCWLIRDLNLPFGGMKSSGMGREGGRDSYHFFTEVKTICVKH